MQCAWRSAIVERRLVTLAGAPDTGGDRPDAADVPDRAVSCRELPAFFGQSDWRRLIASRLI
jgi:hypothetical protein